MILTINQHRERLFIKKQAYQAAKLAEKEARFNLAKLEAEINKYQNQIDTALSRGIKEFNSNVYLEKK